MQKMIVASLFMLLANPGSYAQNKTVKSNKEKANPYKKKLLVDVYKGDIPSGNNVFFTELTLQHKPYADDGAFTLKQTPKKGADHTVLETIGEWTVLKGSAADDNATVVELDASGQVIYYLRRKDTKLQKLDSTLHEIKPAKNYLLVKSKKKK